MIALMLLSSACQSLSADSFCLWFEPITMTGEELHFLSEQTLREIDDVNQEFDEQCNK